MRPAYMRLVDASICLMFIKGLLIVAVTIYTFAHAYQARQATPAVGVAACAAGTLAFGMTCVAVWIRSRLEQPAGRVSPR